MYHQFLSPNGQGIDEQCLAYPFSNSKNIVRVKVECITEQAHKKAYFEPRYIFTVLIRIITQSMFAIFRQGLHGLFGWNLIKDSDKQVTIDYLFVLTMY